MVMIGRDYFALDNIALLNAIVVIGVCIAFCMMNVKNNSSLLGAMWQRAEKISGFVLIDEVKYVA